MFKKLKLKLLITYLHIRHYFLIKLIERDIRKQTGIKVKIKFAPKPTFEDENDILNQPNPLDSTSAKNQTVH